MLVWRFDRFARSTKHLVEALHTFKHLKIDFISYSEAIDTGSPLGEAIFTIISAMAQLERDIIRERVKGDLRSAREAGTVLGRPKAVVDNRKLKQLHKEGYSVRDIGKQVGISKSAVARLLTDCPRNPLEMTF